MDGWLLVAACSVVAGLYQGCFSSTDFLVPVVVAAVCGGLCASVSAALSARPLYAIALSLLLFGAFTVVTVLRPTMQDGLPGMATWSALRDGVIGGWLQLLTTSAPVDSTPVLLVFPVIVSWWCAWGVMWLARHSRHVLVPVLPALAVLAISLLYGASGLSSSSAITLTWCACVLSGILIRTHRLDDDLEGRAADRGGRHHQRRKTVLEQLALGAPTAALAIVVTAIVFAALQPVTGAARFDLRSVVQNPFTVEPTLTPLATIQGQLAQSPPRKLYAIRHTGARIDRVRIAALDTFDGFVWTAPRDSFLPAGRTLASDDLVEGGTASTLSVRVIGPTKTPFLPVVGEPRQLTASGLGYSPSGVLAAPTPSVPPMSYVFDSVLRPYADLTRSARIAILEPPQTYTSLPPPPAALPTIAGRITSDDTSPYEKLSAISRYLKTLPYDPEARPGHSYGAITRMLVRAKSGDENGYAEQHASAFVVLARILGIPARVAVGYLVDADALATGKEVTVTTANAHAWAEVPIDGYGWVPFETVNLTKAKVAQSRNEVVAPNTDAGSVAGPGASTGGAPGTTDGANTATSVLRGFSRGLLIMLALVTAYVVVVVSEKHRRRWTRRRRRTMFQQIAGAWAETQERLTERGVPSRTTLTVGEIAQTAREVVGAPASATGPLAELVSLALFAPQPPGPLHSQEAWRLATQVRHDLTQSERFGARLRAVLDPRPLVPRFPARDRRARSRGKQRSPSRHS